MNVVYMYYYLCMSVKYLDLSRDTSMNKSFTFTLQSNSDVVDENVEPQPLWEYPCSASGQAGKLLTVDFTKSVKETSSVETNIKLSVDR